MSDKNRLFTSHPIIFFGLVLPVIDTIGHLIV